MKTYFERRYCDECIDVHWVEVQNVGDKPREKIVCHGYAYYPSNTPTHFVKSAGRYGYYVIAYTKLFKPAPVEMPLAWQMAADAHHQDIEF